LATHGSFLVTNSPLRSSYRSLRATIDNTSPLAIVNSQWKFGTHDPAVFKGVGNYNPNSRPLAGC
jgi:hypothetical protein